MKSNAARRRRSWVKSPWERLKDLEEEEAGIVQSLAIVRTKCPDLEAEIYRLESDLIKFRKRVLELESAAEAKERLRLARRIIVLCQLR